MTGRGWSIALMGVAVASLLTGGAAAGQKTDSLPAVLTVGGSNPALWAPMTAVPTPRANPNWNDGSLGLAMGENLMANFITWIGAEYITDYKDITRISPTTWRENIQSGAVWDDNHFYVNMILHPWQGHFYYEAGRTNGYNYTESFLFTVMGSAMWECCGESHRPSLNDLVTTTFGGTVVGEIFYRWGSQLLSLPGWGWEIPAGILTPTRAFSRWALGRFGETPDPPFEMPPPGAYNIYVSGGWIPSGAAGFVEFGSTYNSVDNLQTGDAPFTHFETAVEVNFGTGKKLPRVQARGTLWPWVKRWSSTALLLVPFQGLDYINNDAYEFGGPSLGVSPVFTWNAPFGLGVALSADGHGMFGGVISEYAELAEPHDVRAAERKREYDFGAGFGWGGAANLSWWRLRLAAHYRQNWFRVVNGSNALDPADYTGAPEHLTTLWGLGGSVRLWRRLELGADYRAFMRKSQYHHPDLIDHPGTWEDRLRIFASIQVRPRPLGLFAF